MKRTLTTSGLPLCDGSGNAGSGTIDVAPEGRPVTPAYAKQRARLLRQELAAAGFDIPHSLALEPVAHQQGFRDWNTLAGSARQQRPTTLDIEREAYDHDSAKLTVAELRAVMAGRPDSTPVLVSHPNGPGGSRSTIYPAEAVTVRSSVASDHLPALVVLGTYASGRYMVPRRLTLELSGLPVEDPPVGQNVIEAARAAIDSLGFRGESNMGNDIETGVITWTYQATEGMPLSPVDETVRRAIARLNPGGWSLVSAGHNEA